MENPNILLLTFNLKTVITPGSQVIFDLVIAPWFRQECLREYGW